MIGLGLFPLAVLVSDTYTCNHSATSFSPISTNAAILLSPQLIILRPPPHLS